MGSDFGNSGQNLCGANSVNNQLIFNGTNGNLNNNNRINTNRVRVSLEFDCNETSPTSCVPSSEWFKYYLIARKNKKRKATHLRFRLHCFENLAIKRAEDSHRNMLANKERFMSVVNSCCGLLKHTASYDYRKRQLTRLKDSPWSEVFDFDEEQWLKVTIKKGYRKRDYYRHIAKLRKQQLFKPSNKQAA